MVAIMRGDRLKVRTAFGLWIERRALSGVVDGADFPVVWVCSEDEWERSQRSGAEPDAVPWPADAVQEAVA